MKTLAEVNRAIDELLATDRAKTKRTVLSKILKRLEFLNLMKDYLTTNPTEEFVTKEINRIENRINALMALFDPTAYKEPKIAMHKFERDNGIPHLREQLRALRFILN